MDSAERERIAYEKQALDRLNYKTIDEVREVLRSKAANVCGKAHDNREQRVSINDCPIRDLNLLCAHPPLNEGRQHGRTYDLVPMVYLADKLNALSTTLGSTPPDLLKQYPDAGDEADLLLKILDRCAEELLGLDYALQCVQDPEGSRKNAGRHSELSIGVPEKLRWVLEYHTGPDRAEKKAEVLRIIRREEFRIGQQMTYVQNRLIKAFDDVIEHGTVLDRPEPPPPKVAEKPEIGSANKGLLGAFLKKAAGGFEKVEIINLH